MVRLALKTLLNRLQSRWAGLSLTHKRLLVLSSVLSLSTLLVAELAVYSQGGSTEPVIMTPPLLNEFGQFFPAKLTVRQAAFGVRLLLLILWSYYVSYQVAVRPVWSTATEAYRKLKETLPAPLAALRAFKTSPEFQQVVLVISSAVVILFAARWWVGELLLLSIGWFAIVFFSCYFQFKAGRYPGTEPEFWGEMAEAGVQYGKHVGKVAALGLAAAGGLSAFAQHRDVSLKGRIHADNLALQEKNNADKLALQEKNNADKLALEREIAMAQIASNERIELAKITAQRSSWWPFSNNK